MARMIHTGQALVDVIVEVPALPARGQNAMATTYARHAGGATNILVAAARQGADAVHAGAIGSGPHCDLVRAALAADGVRVAGEPVPRLDTGISFVMVEPTAERTFVTTLGAERLLSGATLAASAPEAGDLVCVTGYSLVVASTRDPLLDWLAGLPADVRVVLDPGAAFVALPDAVRATMLGLTHVWTGNLEESEALGGRRGMAPAADAVAGHLPDGAVVVVRDGPLGCAVRTGGATAVVPGFPRTPVDTNGAGDAHTGILVAEIAAGTPWGEACRRANAGAAIKVTRRGPATAPTRAEIDAFLAGEDRLSR